MAQRALSAVQRSSSTGALAVHVAVAGWEMAGSGRTASARFSSALHSARSGIAGLAGAVGECGAGRAAWYSAVVCGGRFIFATGGKLRAGVVCVFSVADCEFF